ncbi:hypothetical protein EJB05_11250, partial [Eragrostis curvula]
MVRPPSKGRQRIEMRLILDDAARVVSFSKRKKSLLKKASETALRYGDHVAVIVFSRAGNVSALGSPSVDDVLRRVAPLPAALEEDAGGREAVKAALREAEETRALVCAEKARVRDVGDKVRQAAAGRRFWWEADVEALGETELPVFAGALHALKDHVRRHAERLRSPPLRSRRR